MQGSAATVSSFGSVAGAGSVQDLVRWVVCGPRYCIFDATVFFFPSTFFFFRFFLGLFPREGQRGFPK
jgi:hypothetical protein